jgi:hypothetical protein
LITGSTTLCSPCDASALEASTPASVFVGVTPKKTTVMTTGAGSVPTPASDTTATNAVALGVGTGRKPTPASATAAISS